MRKSEKPFVQVALFEIDFDKGLKEENGFVLFKCSNLILVGESLFNLAQKRADNIVSFKRILCHSRNPEQKGHH